MANHSPRWIRFCLGLGLLLSLAWGGFHVHLLRARIGQMEARPQVAPEQVAGLGGDLARFGGQLQSAQVELQRLAAAAAEKQRLALEVAQLERELCAAAERIDAQRAELEQLRLAQAEDGPRALDRRVQELSTGIEQRWLALDEATQRAAGLAQETRSDLQKLERTLSRDQERMWRDLLGPTVQLLGEDTVGSGVLLPSEPIAGGQDWRTHLITAWHVIRDIQTARGGAADAIPVTIYAPDRPSRSETARLLRHDATLDVALLELNSIQPVEWGARLASREKLRQVRIFARIYAVGCPLGNDPIPTYGEIADTRHVVDGQTYWMISAPTYIGNSGGGIFDSETHELLGIFTKIYTHGALRPTVVPHMGLATPLTQVYDWLDQAGYAGIPPRAQAQMASSPR